MSDLKDNLDAIVDKVEDLEAVRIAQEYPDAEFGGAEARRKLERKLLLKLDARMFILVIIYILNYVSHSYEMQAVDAQGLRWCCRLTVTMQRVC